ncbi:uncharacterized protein isoform X2 [Rhodnius prolixus]|uniref:uncharacterized protein isoform X2 n=1 Tax=Rhodnius prolixus TaxID=13249 RepID=UPI003D18B27C
MKTKTKLKVKADIGNMDRLKVHRECPYCDMSVYSYCDGKLLHDACCCLNPYEHELPKECKLAVCTFLHANSCREHYLITRCCCTAYNRGLLLQ